MEKLDPLCITCGNLKRWLYAAMANLKGLTAEGYLPTAYPVTGATNALLKGYQDGISPSPPQKSMEWGTTPDWT